MFDYTSRYASVKTLVHRREDGSEVNYVKRRFLPRAETLPPLGVVRVTEGDRLDLVAHRALGDPLLFWRLADANNAMNPFKLTELLDGLLVIPGPNT